MGRPRFSARCLEYWLVLGMACMLAIGLGLRLHAFLADIIQRFHGHF